MKKSIFVLSLLTITIGLSSCDKAPQKPEVVKEASTTEKSIKTEELITIADSKTHKSFVAYDANLKGKLPVVFIIPEWWGVTDYVKNRAKQLADLGYLAVVVDMYGDAKSVADPKDAQTLAGPFYGKAQPAQSIFDGILKKAELLPNADANKMAAIGYCFGGAMALNMARVHEPLKGVVSFHGNLMTGVKADNNAVKVLVLNGADDTFVSKDEIAAFKKEMDSAKVDYKFVNYPGAIHSFTNPSSTEIGKKNNLKVAYNKDADEKSWEEMKTFFNTIFK